MNTTASVATMTNDATAIGTERASTRQETPIVAGRMTPTPGRLGAVAEKLSDGRAILAL